MNADYKTGVLTCTMEHIADRVYWVDNNKEIIPRRQEISRILKWLEKQKMVELTKSGAGNRKYTSITVVNYGTYNTSETELGTEIERETEHSLRSIKKKSKEDKSSSRNRLMGELADYWNILAPEEKPPYSMFGKWLKRYADDNFVRLTIGAISDRGAIPMLNGKTATAYVTAALKNAALKRANENQQSEEQAMAEITSDPATKLWLEQQAQQKGINP